jgi:hypothetical protein
MAGLKVWAIKSSPTKPNWPVLKMCSASTEIRSSESESLPGRTSRTPGNADSGLYLKLPQKSFLWHSRRRRTPPETQSGAIHTRDRRRPPRPQPRGLGHTSTALCVTCTYLVYYTTAHTNSKEYVLTARVLSGKLWA